MTALRFLTRPFTARVRISGAAVVLLCASAVLGNVGQYIDRDRAEDQLRAFRQAAALDNTEAQCRSRIVSYMDDLKDQRDNALGDGILDRLGPNDDETFNRAQAEFTEAVRRLDLAEPFRARAVEVCAANPEFDPEVNIP
jgi:hypothetical protein